MALICPDCKDTRFHYDKWEDMYTCAGCFRFYYPQELGAAENPNAGYKGLGARMSFDTEVLDTSRKR